MIKHYEYRWLNILIKMLYVQGNVIRPFMAVICKCSCKARVFIPGKPFKPSQVFNFKAVCDSLKKYYETDR